MHPNCALINRFYTAFQARDATTMGACYHDDASFTDPAFGTLAVGDARRMWAMLCARAGDLRIEFHAVSADDQRGSARWVADYTFSRTGHRVNNRIAAEFEFRDGLILRHVDRFSFWRWSRQALGVSGWLLGWTPWLQAKVRANALKGLAAYSRAIPSTPA